LTSKKVYWAAMDSVTGKADETKDYVSVVTHGLTVETKVLRLTSRFRGLRSTLRGDNEFTVQLASVLDSVCHLC
jgi:hypothetical protein